MQECNYASSPRESDSQLDLEFLTGDVLTAVHTMPAGSMSTDDSAEEEYFSVRSMDSSSRGTKRPIAAVVSREEEISRLQQREKELKVT